MEFAEEIVTAGGQMSTEGQTMRSVPAFSVEPSDAPRGLPSHLDRAIFVPPLFLAGLVIILSGAVSLRVTLHHVVEPLEWLLAAVILLFFWRVRRLRTLRQMVLLGFTAGLAAWLTLVDYSGSFWPTPGNLFCMHPDNWSYQAMADYFEHYPRGRVDRMPMVDEFGSHLLGSRFAAATLLGFLHDLPGLSDITLGYVVFIVVCLVTHFFSMLALGRVLDAYGSWRMPLLAAFLATAGGWLGHAMAVSNNDNLVFAALSPALLALLCPRKNRTSVEWQVILSGALLLAAMLYNYPEGIALTAVLASPLVLASLWLGRNKRAALIRWTELGGIGIFGAILAAPYMPTFVSFLQNQISAAGGDAKGVRPGEGIFTGLVDAHRLPAVFALGEEMRSNSYHLISNFLPVCLCALLVVGAWTLGRRQRWFPWVAVPLVLLFVWQNVAKHYDYGSYKVLICSVWWIYPAISAGLFWCLGRVAWPLLVQMFLVVVLVFAVELEKYENRLAAPPLSTGSQIHALSELPTIRFVAGQAPVLLSLDDDMDHVWATYYLRDRPLATWQQKGYLSMPHITPYLARGITISPEQCLYMLVSGSRTDALWHNARFSLVRRASLFIAGIQNPPNGVEMIAGERYLWLGTNKAAMQIISSQAGNYELRASAFGVGPSMPDRVSVPVEVTDAQGVHTVEVNAATRGLPIALPAGESVVSLRCLGTPALGLHNGDPRELMLGIKGPTIAAVAAEPQPTP